MAFLFSAGNCLTAGEPDLAPALGAMPKTAETYFFDRNLVIIAIKVFRLAVFYSRFPAVAEDYAFVGCFYMRHYVFFFI